MTKTIDIVLIDDHSLVRAGIREFLSRSPDIKVLAEAATGEEAKELIERLQPTLILIDIELPDINGIDIARWVREKFKAIKIIILSCHDDDEYVLSALQAGANGYVLKNTSPQKLIDAIKSVNNNQSSLDPSIATKVMSLATGNFFPPLEEQLSPRELQILNLVALGKTNKEIGKELFISSRTVQGHLSKIFVKLNVETRTEAVVKSASTGLIKINCEM